MTIETMNITATDLTLAKLNALPSDVQLDLFTAWLGGERSYAARVLSSYHGQLGPEDDDSPFQDMAVQLVERWAEGVASVEAENAAYAARQSVGNSDPRRELKDADAEERRIRNTRMCEVCDRPEDACECEEDGDTCGACGEKIDEDDIDGDQRCCFCGENSEPRCQGCGRPESACSLVPCEGVIADRGEGLAGPAGPIDAKTGNDLFRALQEAQYAYWDALRAMEKHLEAMPELKRYDVDLSYDDDASIIDTGTSLADLISHITRNHDEYLAN